jgi:DNA helicase-2/ATP-dependent DNA helicase PcrA
LILGVIKVKNETSEAQWVVNKIQEISSLKNHDDIEGELNFEKIVVLARNKYLFKSLEEALQAANIPHYSPCPLCYLKIMRLTNALYEVHLAN